MVNHEEKAYIELIDDKGDCQAYEFADSFVFDDKQYLILTDEKEEAFLFRIGQDDALIVPDEKEFLRVKEAYDASE